MARKKRKGNNNKKTDLPNVNQEIKLEEIDFDKMSLTERWESYRLNFSGEVSSEMVFDYGHSPLRGEIVEALVFWKFVRDYVSDIKNGMSYYEFQPTNEERVEFIDAFLDHQNRFVRLAAMIELMPIVVWRRILWRYNIDFSSYECFFRRLDSKQAQAIQDNFYQWQMDKSPEVLTAKEKKKFAAEIEGKKEKDGRMRYMSKGAMSHNLLIDFGFNAYGNGETSDEKTEEANIWKFFSIKNHADDFVVNDEFGGYWRLYRSARSNYVWKSAKTVHLSTHICPGFWYTLIMHFWFWILSPAICLVMLGMTAFGYRIEAPLFSLTGIFLVMLTLLAGLTPLWSIAAVLKLLFRSYNFGIDRWAVPVYQQLTKKINSYKEKDPAGWRRKKEWMKFIGCLFVLFIFTLGLSFIMYRVGGLSTALASASALCVFFAFLFYKESRQAEKMPPLFFIPLITSLELLGFDLAWRYSPQMVKGIADAIEKTNGFLVKAIPVFFRFCAIIITDLSYLILKVVFAVLGFIGSCISAAGLIWLITLVPMAVLFLLVQWYSRLPEEKQVKLSDLSERLYKCLIPVGVPVIIYCIYGALASAWQKGIVAESTKSLFGMSFLLLVLFIVTVTLLLRSSEKNPEKQRARKELYQLAGGIVDSIYSYEEDIRKNRWLFHLNADEKRIIGEKIFKLGLIFSDNQRVEALKTIISKVDSFTTVEKIEDLKSRLLSLHSDLRVPVLRCILDKQCDFKTALHQVKLEQERKELNRKMFKKIVWILGYPGYAAICLVEMLIKGLWFILCKFCEIVCTLKWFYDLFTKRCPYVMRSRLLR